MMAWYGGGMGAGAWGLMCFFGVLLIGAIVWLVVHLVSPGRRSALATSGPWDLPARGRVPGPVTGPTPLEVLDRRLAAGEIDLAAYQQTRAALLDSRGGRP